MGIDVTKLRSNILGILKKNKPQLKEFDNANEIIKFKKFNNLIFKLYSTIRKIFGCQQLIAESLGKNLKVFCL